MALDLLTGFPGFIGRRLAKRLLSFARWILDSIVPPAAVAEDLR